MKIFRVKKAVFDKIKRSENKWKLLVHYEHEIIPYLPLLAGGLDHVDETKNQIVFHDTGCNNRDNSFILRKHN